jgi:hypothetical protein
MAINAWYQFDTSRLRQKRTHADNGAVAPHKMDSARMTASTAAPSRVSISGSGEVESSSMSAGGE